jgi:CRISPR-associated protein Cas1
MALIIDTPGTYIGKKSNTLTITTPDKDKKEISLRKIGSLIINSRVQITYDAVIALMQSGIPIVYASKNQPVAVCHPFAHHGTVLTRREQILAYLDKRGVSLAKAFVKGSIENKVRLLLRLAKARVMTDAMLAEEIRQQAHELRDNIPLIDEIEGTLDEARWKIMGYEGDATKKYFGLIAKILPKELNFDRRIRRPPSDPVNSCLSFGYTILYSQVLLMIAAAGLEPFAGFLHSDRSGKPSLALDLMEEFRQPVVDRTMIRLFTRGMLTLADFQEEGGRTLFGETGKKKFLNELFGVINKGFVMDGTAYSFLQLIMNQARILVRFLLKKIPEYTPFLLPW